MKSGPPAAVGALLALPALLAAAACAKRPATAPEFADLPPLARLVEGTTLAELVRYPQPVTTGAADDYLPKWTPDGKAVVYVSDRRGNSDIFIRYLPGSGLVGDWPLTFHTARDTSPSVSPTGEQVAFTSYREDGRGDLFVLNLRLADRIPEAVRRRLYQRFGALLSRPEAEVEREGGMRARVTKYLLSQGGLFRLTDSGAAETEPAWAPQADRIYFTRSEGTASEIYSITLPDRKVEPVTTGGGAMAAPSPDGSRLAFVREGAIFLLELGGGATQRVTSGPMDASPAWSDDGREIFFSRFADDTDGDGEITFADNAAVFAVEASGAPDARVRRLTAGNRSDLFPASRGGSVIFASAPALGKGHSNLMSLDARGFFPAEWNGSPLFDKPSVLLEAGRELEATNLRTSALAYEEVTSRFPGTEGAGEGAFRLGRVLEKLGQAPRAKAAWLLAQRQPSELWALRSRIAHLRLELAQDLATPGAHGEREARVRAFVRELAKISRRAEELPAVRASAKLQEGRAWLEVGRQERAAAAFGQVEAGFPEEANFAAQAMLEKTELYRKFGDKRALLDRYAETLRRYPDAEPWATRAAASAVRSALEGGGEEADKDAALRRIAGEYARVPVLPAYALNVLGDRAAKRGDEAGAEAQFRSVIAQYGKEERQAARAKLSLARLLTHRGKYPEALELYREAESAVPRSDPFRQRARRRFVGNLLAKGRSELSAGDFRMAMRTFRDLVDFDYLIPQAHRGLIAAYAAQGRADRAVALYKGEVRKYPQHYLPRYGLGLAYTYLEPPRRAFDLAQPELEKAVALNGQAVFPHQTLGFVHEKRHELLKEEGHLERALDEYLVARSLQPPDEDFQNYADLTLNIGNGYFLLGDYGKAYDAYSGRSRLDAPFDPRLARLVFLERFARSAFHAGEPDRASALSDEALELLSKIEADRELRGRELLRHRAEITDVQGLVLAQSGNPGRAADAFGRVALLNRNLNDPRNEAKALRNMAINLFDTPAADRTARERRLSDARDTFGRSLGLLAAHGTKRVRAPKIGALLDVEQEVALGEDVSEAAKGFTSKGEKDLIYTFVGRIERERGDDAAALQALSVKESLLPAESSVEETKRPAFLLKRSILANQKGATLARLGRFSEAAQAFRASQADARKIPHETGQASNALSLLRVSLLDPEASPPGEAGAELKRVLQSLSARVSPEAVGLYARLAEEYMGWLAVTLPDAESGGEAVTSPSPVWTSALASVRDARKKLARLPARTAEQEGLILELDLHHFRWSGHRASRAAGKDSLAALEADAARLERDDLVLWAKAAGAELAAVDRPERTAEAVASVLAYLSGRPPQRLRRSFPRVLGLLERWIDRAAAAGAAEEVYNATEWRSRVLLASATLPLPERSAAPEGMGHLAALRTNAHDPAAWQEGVAALEETDRGLASLFRLDIVDAAELMALLGPDRVYARTVPTSSGRRVLTLTRDGIRLAGRPDTHGLPRDFYVSDASLCAPGRACSLVASATHLYYALLSQSFFDRRILIAAGESPGVKGEGRQPVSFSGRSDFEKQLGLADWFWAPSPVVPAGAAFATTPLEARFLLPDAALSSFERTLPARLLLGSGASVALLPSAEPPVPASSLSLLAEWWARGGVATLLEFPAGQSAGSVLAALSSKRLGDAAARPGWTLFGALGLTPEEAAAAAAERLSETIAAGAAFYRAERWLEAVRAFEQALATLDARKSDEFREQILDAASTAAWKGGDLPRATALAERLVAFRREARSPALADSLQFLGVLRSRAEDFVASVRALEEATELYRASGAPPLKVAESLSTRGIVTENAARYREALRLFDQSLEIYRAAESKSGVGDQWRRIGRIYYLRLNDYARAEEAFAKAGQAFKAAGETQNRDEAELEIGLVAERRADFPRAREIYLRIFKEANKRADPGLSAKAALFAANTYWYEGDYFEAFRWQRAALASARQVNDDRMTMLAHSTLGLIYWTLNNHEKALSEQAEALALARKLASPLDEASAHNNAGLVLRDRGDLRGSIDRFEMAVAIDRELQSAWGLSYDYRNLGISETRLGLHERARRHLEEAIRLSESIGNDENEAKARLSLADLLLIQKQPDGALMGYQRALLLARQANLREVQWRALQGLARISSARGLSAQAQEHLRAAIDVVEKMGAAIRIEEFRNGFITDKASLYEDMILELLREGDARKTEAWSYAERARSRSFIDLLGNRELKLRQPADARLLDRDRASRQSVNDLENRLSAAADPAEKDRIRAELEAARRRREELLIDIRAQNPALSSFVSVDVISLPELQELLGPDTALVEYFLTKEEILAWVITAEGIELARVRAGRKELEAKLVAYSRLMQEQKPLIQESQELHALLAAPLERQLEGKRYVGISPHGALHYLSFSSLFDGRRYFVDRHALFYTPSASVLKFTLAGRPADRSRVRVLAVGNPDLGTPELDLPFAEKEVGALARQFPEIDVLTRKSATERGVTEQIGNYQIVHFASHGEFDPVNPLYSAILLAPSGEAGGQLQAEEVFGLALKADLVTLSACQTGVAKIEGGDELIGLNRAFLYAGTRSVLSSLWRVSDVSTAVLVKRFYRNYLTQTKAESLREAQLLVRDYYPHPAYWAALALTGHYR